MKTKLLRQIRNRYVIKIVDKLPSNASKELIEYIDVFTKYPVYFLIDKKDSECYDYESTYEEAHNTLREWISMDYIHLKKRKSNDGIFTVVWGNNK